MVQEEQRPRHNTATPSTHVTFHSNSSSVWLVMTCESTMEAHPPRVKTFLATTLSLPCTLTTFAIWITGSLSA